MTRRKFYFSFGVYPEDQGAEGKAVYTCAMQEPMAFAEAYDLFLSQWSKSPNRTDNQKFVYRVNGITKASHLR